MQLLTSEITVAATSHVEKPKLYSIKQPKTLKRSDASGRPPPLLQRKYSWAEHNVSSTSYFSNHEVATIIRIVLWCIGRKHYSSNECWKAHAIFDYLLAAASDPPTANLSCAITLHTEFSKIWGCYHHSHSTLMYRCKTLWFKRMLKSLCYIQLSAKCWKQKVQGES